MKFSAALLNLALVFSLQTAQAGAVEEWLADSLSRSEVGTNSNFFYKMQKRTDLITSKGECSGDPTLFDKKTSTTNSSEAGPVKLELQLINKMTSLYKLKISDRFNKVLNEVFIYNTEKAIPLTYKYYYGAVFKFSESKGLRPVKNSFKLPCSSCSGNFTGQGSAKSTETSLRLVTKTQFQTVHCGYSENKLEKTVLTLE